MIGRSSSCGAILLIWILLLIGCGSIVDLISILIVDGLEQRELEEVVRFSTRCAISMHIRMMQLLRTE